MLTVLAVTFTAPAVLPVYSPVCASFIAFGFAATAYCRCVTVPRGKVRACQGNRMAVYGVCIEKEQ